MPFPDMSGGGRSVSLIQAQRNVVSIGAVGAQPEQSYRIVYERLCGVWHRDEVPNTDRFHTQTAKGFYLERKAFLDRFMQNLE